MTLVSITVAGLRLPAVGLLYFTLAWGAARASEQLDSNYPRPLRIARLPGSADSESPLASTEHSWLRYYLGDSSDFGGNP